VLGYRADILDAITADEDVQPTVIVEIEEPGGKTVERFGHTGVKSDVGEFPGGLGGSIRALRTFVVVKNFWLATKGKQQVGPHIVVIVTVGDGIAKDTHE